MYAEFVWPDVWGAVTAEDGTHVNGIVSRCAGVEGVYQMSTGVFCQGAPRKRIKEREEAGVKALDLWLHESVATHAVKTCFEVVLMIAAELDDTTRDETIEEVIRSVVTRNTYRVVKDFREVKLPIRSVLG